MAKKPIIGLLLTEDEVEAILSIVKQLPWEQANSIMVAIYTKIREKGYSPFIPTSPKIKD